MRSTKHKVRSKISDDHLEKPLRIATTSIEPDTDELLSQKQGQICHYFYVYVAPFLNIIINNTKNKGNYMQPKINFNQFADHLI